MKNLKEMNLIEFSQNFINFSDEQLENLVNSNDINELNNDILYAFFLRSNDSYKIKLIDDKTLFLKILNFKNKQLFLKVLYNEHTEIFKYLINSKSVDLCSQDLLDFISKLNINDLQIFLSKINVDNLLEVSGYLFDDEFIRNYINLSFPNFRSDLVDRLLISIKSNKVNPYLLTKIKNESELKILSCFNILISCDELSTKDFLILENGDVILSTIIDDIKPKYIIKLINDMKIYENFDANLFFELAFKFYLLFDFDNAKKILNGKFSYLNKSTIKRVIDYNFKDSRREFRFDNQHKFYYHGIIKDLTESISINDDSIIINILGNSDEVNIQNFKDNYKNLNSENDRKAFINAQINNREDEHKRRYTNKMSVVLEKKLDKSLKEKSINYKKMQDCLKDLDLEKIYNLNDKEKQEITYMFLGNAKYDNDALLRIIFNDEALGLKINSIVNKFTNLKKLSKKSNISMNLVLNLVELLKVDFYSIPPNCKDIYLNTLTKISSSKKFVINSKVDVLKETMKLHVNRKFKVKSNIPSVNEKNKSFSYGIVPFDSEYLMSIGHDSDNCMKIGGQGEEFFRYCLLSLNAGILKIDYNGEIYYCPIVRSGNGIHINGIEPKIDNENIDGVIAIIKLAMEKIIDKSYESNEKINYATITDLHIKGKISGLNKYEITEALPLMSTTNDKYVYTDYNKKEINNYIVCERDFEEAMFYEAKAMYYQDRINIYEYNVEKEYDPDRLNLLVNMIEYSSIEYLNVDTKEKNRLRRVFKNIDVTRFLYIAGSKDWYVAIDENYNLIAKILPYDERANKEYLTYISKVIAIVQDLKREKDNDRRM